MNASLNSAASRFQNEANRPERLLTFREVGELIGSKCRTAHTVLQLAKRGQIEAVRLNERVIRYRESSVRRLIEGRASVVARGFADSKGGSK